MIKDIIKNLLVKHYYKKGISPYFAGFYAANMYFDYKKAKVNEYKEVHKAHLRGFFYENTLMYQINDTNYTDYLSDLDYYSLFPINKEYSNWIDDKLTLKYILGPYSECMPKYYFLITKSGGVINLPDAPKKYVEGSINTSTMIELLDEVKELVFKKKRGSVSDGLYIIKNENGNYFVNEESIAKTKLIDLIDALRDYIVQEYISFSNDFPEQTDCIRLVVINETGRDPVVFAAYLYINDVALDTDKVTTTYLGNIDIETGQYHSFRLVNLYKTFSSVNTKGFTNRGIMEQEYVFDGEIPNWNIIKDKLKEISGYIPQISYIGVDVIANKTDFKILEMNSHQNPIGQIYHPFMKENSISRNFFENQLKEKKRTVR